MRNLECGRRNGEWGMGKLGRRVMDDGRGKKDEKRANKIRTVIELTDSGQVAAETQTWVEFTFQCN